MTSNGSLYELRMASSDEDERNENVDSAIRMRNRRTAIENIVQYI